MKVEEFIFPVSWSCLIGEPKRVGRGLRFLRSMVVQCTAGFCFAVDWFRSTGGSGGFSMR